MRWSPPKVRRSETVISLSFFIEREFRILGLDRSKCRSMSKSVDNDSEERDPICVMDCDRFYKRVNECHFVFSYTVAIDPQCTRIRTRFAPHIEDWRSFQSSRKMTSRRDHLLPSIPVEIRKCLSDASKAWILTKKVLDEMVSGRKSRRS